MISFISAFLWLVVLLGRIITNSFEISPIVLSSLYCLLILYGIRDGLNTLET